MLSTLSDVVTKTRAFFQLHWPQSWGAAPEWASKWDMNSDHPNHLLSGCYVLLNSSGGVVYVGKGSQRAKGALARRLLGHVVHPIPRTRQYEINIERWPTVVAIHTIAFRDDRSHLALALEAYLIRECPSERNIHGRA